MLMRSLRSLFLLLWSVPFLHAQVLPREDLFRGNQVHILQNSLVKFSVYVGKDNLISDRLETQSQWAAQYGAKAPPSIETDADFALDIMYTDWQAPGKANNSENPILLTKKDGHRLLQVKTKLRLCGRGRVHSTESIRCIGF